MIPYRDSLLPPFQASKWLHCRLLVDEEEMSSLFEALGPFWIVRVSGLIPIGQEIIPKEEFLAVYQTYVEALKKGEISSDPRFRITFSSVLTHDLSCLYAMKVNPEQSMVKILTPVIQLQNHRIDYSQADRTFRSMVMGFDSIQWGLQFSYPHLFQNEKWEVFTVRDTPQFPNTALFSKLQKWVRANTLATPFEVEGKKINVPIRLGKKCFPWINTHPQIIAKRLNVLT